MSKYWITSDSHLGHGNIVKYCKRLVFCNEQEKQQILHLQTITDKTEKRTFEKSIKISRETVERMDNTLIKNINDKIGPDDWLIHAGDFCFGEPADWARYRAQINCKNIILCLGNHDLEYKFADLADGFSVSEEKLVFDEKLFTKVYPHGKPINFMIHERRYVISHYPQRAWDQSHRSSVMCYGHVHGGLKDDPNVLSFDVGVDCNFFLPLNIPGDTDWILANKKRKLEWFES